MVEKVGWRRARIETESVERVCRHMAQRVVLHDQVAEAIEDRFTVVDLDAHQDMRPVSREDIGARVARWHGIARKARGLSGHVQRGRASKSTGKLCKLFRLLPLPTIRDLCLGCQVYSTLELA